MNKLACFVVTTGAATVPSLLSGSQFLKKKIVPRAERTKFFTQTCSV